MRCKKCTSINVVSAIGHCSGCGALTSSMMYQLCDQCSSNKNECQVCRVSLVNPQNPGNGSGSGSGSGNKSSFMVAIDTDHYLPGGAPRGSDVIAIALQDAFASFKRDLTAWIQGRNPNPSVDQEAELTVTTEMPRMCTVVVECSNETAESLKHMPGVALVAPLDRAKTT